MSDKIKGKLNIGADGSIFFYCQACKQVHGIKTGQGAGPRWGWNGDHEKPTFTPSVLVNQGMANPEVPLCHSFVTDGRIQYLSDCTHEMAGQAVELQNFTWGNDD